MHSNSSNPSLWKLVRLLAAVVALQLLCQCQSLNDWRVSTMPSEIPMGAPKVWVLGHLGGPEGKEPWYYDPQDVPGNGHLQKGLTGGCQHTTPCHCAQRARPLPAGSAGSQAVGEIWHYQDDMNPQGRWLSVATAWRDPFCSWDIYFDRRGRYVGWRLVEPTSGQRGRERFVSSDYGPRTDRLWTRKVERLLRGYREHLGNPHAKMETLQEASRVVAHELSLVPSSFPEKLRLQRVCHLAQVLGSSTPGQLMRVDGDRAAGAERAGWTRYHCLIHDAAAEVDAVLREL